MNSSKCSAGTVEINPKDYNFAPVLYSGTTARYALSRYQEMGGFSHRLGSPVNLTRNYLYAFECAQKHAQEYDEDAPMILIVNPRHLDFKRYLSIQGEEVDVLNPGSFCPFKPIVPNVHDRMKVWSAIDNASMEISRLSRNDLEMLCAELFNMRSAGTA